MARNIGHVQIEDLFERHAFDLCLVHQGRQPPGQIECRARGGQIGLGGNQRADEAGQFQLPRQGAAGLSRIVDQPGADVGHQPQPGQEQRRPLVKQRLDASLHPLGVHIDRDPGHGLRRLVRHPGPQPGHQIRREILSRGQRENPGGGARLKHGRPSWIRPA